MSKKRGRPPIPIAMHILRGTYRKDRHGPRPPMSPATYPPVTPRRSTESIADPVNGTALITAIEQAWEVGDVVAQTYLRTMASAYDRRQAIAVLLDGPAGLLTQLSSGQAGISAKAARCC